MAKKITELTQLTSPARDDLIIIEDTSASQTKYATVEDLLGPSGVKFSAYKSANQTGIADTTSTKITFDTERFDTGNDFASSTFTVPVTGFYQLNVYLLFTFSGGATGVSSILSVHVNGAEVRRRDAESTNTTNKTLSTNQYSELISLTAGDTVEIYAQADVGSGTVTVVGGSLQSTFNGYLVSRI